jgi:hypothetical protein
MNPIDNPRQRILKTFRHEPLSRIVWQPELYYWYYGNRIQNKLPVGYEDPTAFDAFYQGIQPYNGKVPERYRQMSMLELYDDLGASPRYAHEILGISVFKEVIDPQTVTVHHRRTGVKETKIYETPQGNLQERTHHGYHVEYPVKSTQDMKVMQSILEQTEFRFDANKFQIADRAFGERGLVQAFFPRAPLQRLIVSYMGFENTIYALQDHPNQTKDFMRAIEAWDDEMYEVIEHSPLEVLNFGENIDAFVDSPRLFSEYLLPYYNRRVDQLHQHGKFCHIHMDGALKPLLPYIKETHFDAIEAVTPLPQGDVTLEEAKEALGDKILIDGIPAIAFLPDYPLEDLLACAWQVLELFSPNLILGVSDELPPPADIERIRGITSIVDQFCPKSEADSC